MSGALIGSSPRAWGTPSRAGVGSASPWFIPTGVGNTKRSITTPAVSAVHPHGRGEHEREDGACRIEHGSSPRAWGTRGQQAYQALMARFIPTGVGNTFTRMSRCTRWPVHPHGRGEHQASASTKSGENGSSPRAWGTLHRLLRDYIVRRFIPTGVGNTPSSSVIFRMVPVHPHGRGEHAHGFHHPHDHVGSSPRAWGTRSPAVGWAVTRRFIPTGVGNTAAPCGQGCAGTVHPHGRGEHSPSNPVARPERGSSPRAWGTPKSS